MTTPAEELTALQQQIDRTDPEALLDLLNAHRERTLRRLHRALGELRAATEVTTAGHERLASLLGRRPTT